MDEYGLMEYIIAGLLTGIIMITGVFSLYAKYCQDKDKPWTNTKN